jgi:hypothetical protein
MTAESSTVALESTVGARALIDRQVISVDVQIVVHHRRRTGDESFRPWIHQLWLELDLLLAGSRATTTGVEVSL